MNTFSITRVSLCLLALALLFNASCIAAVVSGQVWTGAKPMTPALESVHPYGPSANSAMTFEAPSGTKTRVHFAKIDTEPGYDYVRIYDSSNVLVAAYSGWNQTDIWTPWVNGKTVKIQITSDGSVQGYGWLIDRYATDDTATPVPAVTVTFSPGGMMAVTSADGTYTSPNLAAGTYTVTPSLAGVGFSPASINTTITDAQGATADFEGFDDHINSVSVSPNPFSPTGLDATTITAAGKPNASGLYARIIVGTLDQTVNLTETSAGHYTATWDGLDHSAGQAKIPVSGSMAVRIYNQTTDQFSVVGSVTIVSVDSVSASPTVFYPTTGQSTAITVNGAAGLPLVAGIANSQGTVIRTIPLVWNSDRYTAAWDGRDDANVFQPAGSYEIRVYRQDTGTRYTATGTVSVGLAAGITGQIWTGAAVMQPAAESAHPYGPGENSSYTFTSPSGTKTRVHFARIDVEPGYDHVKVYDGSNNLIADYTGWNLGDIWTPWVPGNTVVVKLTSDASAQGYGWSIDRYATDDIVSPMSGVLVTLSPGGRSAVTGTNGTYTISDLSPTTYTVTPSLAGSAFSPRSVGIAVSAAQGGVADFEGFDDLVTSLTASPNPFTPSGENNTTITAAAPSGQTGLYARIIGGSIDQHIDLTETGTGTYTGTWDGLDKSGSEPKIPASGNFVVNLYNKYTDRLTRTVTIALNSITAVSSSPGMFYPTSGQSTVVTVAGSDGLSLELRVTKPDGRLVRTLPLTWSAGSYTATWDGKNDNYAYAPAGTYDLRVYVAGVGTRYAVTGTVTIGQAAGVIGQVWTGVPTVLSPAVESAHPYGPSENSSYTVTSPSGTKTRVHFARIDTEPGYDHVKVYDGSNNLIADYTGWNLGDIWTPWVPGNTVTIKMTSDGSVQGYGFIIDRYITDDLASGVAGVTVTLSPGGKTATTGADGSYSISDLSPGTYTVTPALAGWAFTPGNTSVSVSSTQGGLADFRGYTNEITAFGVAPVPFAPSGANAATITATGTADQTGLYTRVIGGTINQRVDLPESGSGTYTGAWDGLDRSGSEPRIPVSGTFTAYLYNQYSDKLPSTATFALKSIDSVSAGTSPFYPTSGQTTTISARGANGLPVEVRIANSSGTIVRVLPLVWNSDAYYVTWDGKDAGGAYQPAGTYELRIYRQDTGTRYVAMGSVAIGVPASVTGQVWTGATLMQPTAESPHPYAPSENRSYTFTAPSGTKTKVHFERIDTETNYDHVKVYDGSNNLIADYSGWNLSDIWTPWVPGNTVTIKITSDGSVQGYGWSIDRYATDDTISPVEGALISLSPSGRTATTGADGSYSFSDLAPRLYSVTPSEAGYKFSPAFAGLSLAAAQNATQDFEAWQDWVSSTSANPNPFAPSGANSTAVTAAGISGQAGMYARITGGGIDQKISLPEGPSGSYTGAWDGLDHSYTDPRILPSGSYTARIYNQHGDPFSATASITVNSVTAVSANPASFYGTAGQTTTITVSGASGLPLEIGVVNSGGTVVRTIPMVWSSGAYTAVWDGKSDSSVVQAPGNHELRVHRADTGARYTASASCTVLPAAAVQGHVWIGGQELLPVAESPHPYGNNVSNTWTITSSGGTKMSVHFEKIDIDTNDHLYIKDANNNVIADYRGTYYDLWSPWITGQAVKIQLVSNASVTGYGFLADRYVSDATVFGLDGTTITIMPGNRKIQTDTSGSYSVNDLLPGTYTVTPSKTGWTFDPVSTGVTISAGAVTTADFWGIKSAESLNSIAQAKSRQDGWSVDLPYKAVSATFAGGFYIEEEDRSAGIRVDWTPPVPEGNSVHVIGRMTTVNGERVIQPYTVGVQPGTAQILPLFMPGLNVTGGSLNSYTPGADGAFGLNNSGLLVKVSGKVNAPDSTGFYVDDGSRLNDGLGLRVTIDNLYTGRTITLPNAGDWVTVTGIAATRVNGGLERIIKARSSGDIRKVSAE